MELARAHVLVCGGTGCTSSGSEKIIAKFESCLAENGLSEEIKVIRTGCFGLCALGPIVIVYPEGAFYSMVNVDDVEEIVSEHLLKGDLFVIHIYFNNRLKFAKTYATCLSNKYLFGKVSLVDLIHECF